MKTLNTRLFLIVCLLAAAFSSTAKNPYQYTGGWSGTYFMDVCPFESNTDKQWMSHFVQECGFVTSVLVSTTNSQVSYGDDKGAVISVKGNVRFRDSYFRCHIVNDWLRFVPTRYKIEWTLTAHKGSAASSSILSQKTTTFWSRSDEGLADESNNYSIKHYFTTSLFIRHSILRFRKSTYS